MSLAEAKKQCEIAAEVTYHDAHLTALVTAARQKLESDTGLVLADGIYQWWLTRWPEERTLEIAYIWPIRAVSAIHYYDPAGNWQTFPPSSYTLMTTAVRPYISLADGSEWPAVKDTLDAIRIDLVAGYASAADVPAIAKQAILMLVSYWWHARLMTSSAPTSDIERVYQTLTASLRKASYP